MVAQRDEDTLDGDLAYRILDRMGQVGQPPPRGALAVNVGTDDLLGLLRVEYLEPIRRLRRVSAFKLVQAPFGGGKTHFLHCLREVAWQEGFLAALVSVSAQETPCDDPVRVYQAVAQTLEAPPASPLEEGDPGIDALLRDDVQRRVAAHGRQAVLDWIERDLARARVDSHAVRRAAEVYVRAVVERDDASARLMAAFLRGEDVKPHEVRAHGVREALSSSTGFRFLRSLAQVVRALDLPGVVLLFDEMDRVMALPQKRRRAVGDTVRQVIDQCGQASLPGLLWVYAVPPEFMSLVVPEYPALEQRLRGVPRFDALSPQSPLIDLDHLPLGPTEMLRAISERLLALYQAAHGAPLDAEVQRANLGALARAKGSRQLETGGRRDFVKAAVDLLTRQHRGGEARLTPGEIGRWAGGQAAAPAPSGPAFDDDEMFL
jgi:hypothetical protein